MSDFDFNDIRRLDGGLLLVFRELLRRRRASAVAETLGLSQSAVSHALGRLRDLFGDPLFVRRPHGLEPTRRALALAPRIEALVDLAGAALQRDGVFDPAKSARRFNISAPEFVSALIGARLVQSIRTNAPQASFVMQALTHDAALDAIKRGEIDFAIGRFGAARPGFVVELLYEDRYCVVARRGHPRFNGRIGEAAYREAGHIFAGSPHEGDEGGDDGDSRDIAFNAIVPRWLAALVMVASCDAIATVPRRLAERQSEVLGLQILRAPFVHNRIAVSTVRRAGGEDAGADWFLDQVRTAVN